MQMPSASGQLRVQTAPQEGGLTLEGYSEKLR
jgi:hypothetical protein